jgi:hypothetical protein
MMLFHFSLIAYQLPIILKYCNARKTRINEEAIIIKILTSKSIRINSNAVIVGIDENKTEIRILLAINNFLTTGSLKNCFL